MTTVNWQELMGEAQNGTAGVVPPGEYDVVVAEATAATSQSGKLMFKCKMRVIFGPHTDRMIYNNFVVSPESANALKFFFQHMAIFGLDSNFFAQNPAPEYVAQILLGRQCKLRTELRQYNGADQVDVKAVMPPTPGVVPQAPGAAVPQAAVPAPAPVAPAPAPAPVPAPAAAPMAQPVPAPAPPVAPAPVPVAPAPVPQAPAPVPAPAPAPVPQAPAPAAPVAPAPPPATPGFPTAPAAPPF